MVKNINIWKYLEYRWGVNGFQTELLKTWLTSAFYSGKQTGSSRGSYTFSRRSIDNRSVGPQAVVYTGVSCLPHQWRRHCQDVIESVGMRDENEVYQRIPRSAVYFYEIIDQLILTARISSQHSASRVRRERSIDSLSTVWHLNPTRTIWLPYL